MGSEASNDLEHTQKRFNIPTSSASITLPPTLRDQLTALKARVRENNTAQASAAFKWANLTLEAVNKALSACERKKWRIQMLEGYRGVTASTVLAPLHTLTIQSSLGLIQPH